MKIRIAERIKEFRKGRKMTQEQLAEALGVTIGAVSKWESGSSVPDILLIVELADFFETSVDVLLGYEWHGGSVVQCSDRIRALRNAKDFEAASAEAEKALQKYPNSFEIVFKSAIMYSLKGIERGDVKAYERAVALFERSIELIGQNTDPHVSESTIRGNIADVYICLGKTDKALEQMKSNNPDNVNDGKIGYVLAQKEKKPDEALPYLSDALLAMQSGLFRVMSGYAAAYSKKKDTASAIDALLFMKSINDGLMLPGYASYYNKANTILLTACACCEYERGDMEAAREYLRKAKKEAEYFDASPDYGFEHTRFFCGSPSSTAFDDFGSNAVEGIGRAIKNDDASPEELLSIWEEVKQEN